MMWVSPDVPDELWISRLEDELDAVWIAHSRDTLRMRSGREYRQSGCTGIKWM